MGCLDFSNYDNVCLSALGIFISSTVFIHFHPQELKKCLSIVWKSLCRGAIMQLTTF
jgi:hypothetical protein